MFRAGAVGLMLFLSPALPASKPPGDTLYDIDSWIYLAESDFRQIRQEHAQCIAGHQLRLAEIDAALSRPEALFPEYGYPLLLEKTRAETQIRKLHTEAEIKLVRLRYRKSVEMLKILYEKILSMDHHFTSLRTNQQVLRMSNPHEYPEFKEVKTLLEERMKKKYGFALPAVMESNPYLSAVYSIVGLALGGADNRLQQTRLQRISCILDFTVRMHQDLNVVYYETEYLRDANLTLKKECETLFTECARQVGYAIPLANCRETDDWERLHALLDQYTDKAIQTAGTTPALQQRSYANLQFAVDRVVHFIETYCAFVAQGNAYYKKFAKIVSGYANEQTCTDALPESFHQLKNDIEITLEKFNSAYNLPEIQGSRLKDLLYGIGE